jgi:hypothetical protein
MKEWYTAADLAALGLPGVPSTKAGVLLRANTENWTSRKREGRGGGAEYPLSALPTAAQIKLTLAAQRDAKAQRDTKAATATAPAEPAAVDRNALWAWFAEAPETKKAKARERLAVLEAVEALYHNGVTRDVAVMSVARHHAVSASTLYNWLALVAGHDRSDWLPALAPRHAGRTATVDCDPAAWDMLKSDYLRLSAPPFSDCYGRMVRAAGVQGWTVPAERTLLRRLQATVHPAVITLCREGVEKARRMYPAQERDRSHFHALEAINGDGHRWDIWVEWPDGEVLRPNMVAFQDLYSGLILAHRVDKTANSWSVRLAIGDLIENYGIPKACWLDNGRDFASKWLTGGIPNRYRFKVKEEEPVGILTQLRVNIHWTTPYSGQSKPIERAFKDFASDIARHPAFEGAYTGNSPTTKPENYKSRAIKLEDFLKVLASEINEHNDRIGRTAKNCRGRSFRQTFAESYATAPVTKATEEQRRLWLLAAEGINVNSRDGSLKLMGNRYWAEFLHLHLGETVAARFDPDWLHDGLHVYRLDGAYLGHAPVVEASGFDSAEKAQEHNRARKSWLRAARQMAEAEVRMSAAKVAELVPLNLGPAEPATATVVQLARPTLDLKRGPARSVTPDQEASRDALVVEFRQPEPASGPVPDDRKRRFEKALAFEALLASGGEIGQSEVEWLQRYQGTPEYRAQRQVLDDFAPSPRATA